MKTPMIEVYEGGGAKGAAYVGAVGALQERGYPAPLAAFGASAGAITAALRACGASHDFLRTATFQRAGSKRVLETFLDLDQGAIPQLHREKSPTYRVLQSIGWLPGFAANLIFDRLMAHGEARAAHEMIVEGGAFEGDVLTDWLSAQIAALGWRDPWLSFGELLDGTGVWLEVVATDLTLGQALRLNPDTTPGLSIAHAVRMSSSIPGVWKPVVWDDDAHGSYEGVRLNGHLIVDGGIRDNFPIARALEYQEAYCPTSEIVGFVLAEDVPFEWPSGLEEPGSIETDYPSLEIAGKLLQLFLGNRGTGRWPSEVCVLPAKGMGTVEFGAPDEKLEALMGSAYRATATHMDQRELEAI